MSDKPLLYVHAGHPKCGSTRIRSLLMHNRERLSELGCYLLGDRFEIAADNAIADWPLWFLEGAAKQPAGYLLERLDEALERHSDLNIRALVLSAENLANPATAALLDPVFDRFETRVVYYMRRQDHFLASSWRQWALKRGIGFEQHVARRMAEGKPDFPGTLDFWESRVGSDRIHARFLDSRFLTKGDLAADFFTALGVDGYGVGETIEGNESPDRAILLYLQQNPSLFESVHDDAPIALLAGCDVGEPERLAVDRRMQESIIMAYEEKNQGILARFGEAGHAGQPVILRDATVEEGEYRLTARDRERLDRIFASLISHSLKPKQPPR